MNLLKYLNAISKTKVKDSIVLSLICGLIGAMAMDLSDLLLWRTKKTEFLHGHLAGSMMMRSYRTNQGKNFVLGQIFHWFIGAALGIPMYNMLKKTGKDHHLVKGAFMGMLAWGVLNNFGQRFRLFTARAHLTKSHYVALFNNLLYGITTAELMVRFAHESLFTQHSLQQESTSSVSSPVAKATSREFIAEKNDPIEEQLPLQ